MKRKLSLLLAVVMILGTFSFAFADDDFDVPAFLEKEGILKGNTKGDLMLDEPLLRKDAVVLLARLLKAEDEAEAFEKEGLPTFNDLAGNPYYNAFLAWAEDNGYFTGKPDGSFGYEDNLEAVEYALVLLRALGYVNEDKADEWEKAWDTAKELGLLEDVKAERREEILRKEVAQMTYNALGVTMKDSDKTLAEFLGITLPEPDVLEVVEVYTENLAEVVVELSNAKLADKAKLENPANYRLSGTNDPVVTAAKVDGNNVILTLVPSGNVQEMKDEDLNKALVKGRKYDLTIRNIAREINKTYKGILAEDNAIPAVEKVEFMGDYGIKVVTTEPVKVPQERNFVVDGTRTSMFVEQYGRVIILTPYHDKAFPEDAKTLTVKGLEDFAGYKSVESDYELELSTDKDAPKVVKALRNGHKLTVEFDRDIYRKSVKGYESRRDLGNVSFQERRVTFYAEEAKKVAPNVAVYTFEREIPKNAEVTVEGVQNHFKIEMEKEVVNPDLFVDEYAPVIISKLVNDIETKGNEKKGEITQATESLKITFDKDIQEFVEHQKEDGKQIKVEDFFTLYELNVNNKGKEAAKEVEIVIEEVKDDYIKLSFKNIRVNNKDRDYDYVLEVRDFSDLNRNRMEREYIDFQIVEASEDFKLTGINVIPTGRYETEVRLFFNAPVDKEIASDRTNYFFGDKKATAASEAIVERDGETVTLVVGKKIEDVRDYGILEVSPKVIDIDENKIASIEGESSRFWNLKTEEIIDRPETLPADKVVKVLGIEQTQEPADEVQAVNPVKASVTGIQFAADVSTNNQFDVIITEGNTVTTETFTVAVKDATAPDNTADLVALAEAINAKNLGVKATVDTDKLDLEADEAKDMDLTVAGIALLDSSDSNYVAPVVTPGKAKVEAKPAVNQIVKITFEKLPENLKEEMKVEFFAGGTAVNPNNLGEVKSIVRNVVEVEIPYHASEVLTVGASIDKIVFSTIGTTVTLDNNYGLNQAVVVE
ncbi:exported hypothetical protein [[Clostridium] ultunense Esp]|nr:exported hypothetical protein [[Clostridium] ultunense Esp]